jgi:uncharacterized protein YbbC (DUF1343 family)
VYKNSKLAAVSSCSDTKYMTDMRCICVIFIFSVLINACSGENSQDVIQPGATQTGRYLNLLKNKRVGIVANHTSFIYTTHIVDSLLNSGINIEVIFTPEHGFQGSADAGALVGNDLYGSDSILIVSLYGKSRKPAASDMKRIDIMVFDLQDVGVRFYTYLSTLHYVMEACAENNIPLIVLDRPNPLGFYFDGPVLEKECTSFVGLHPVPIVVGLTIGEYARMINGQFWLSDSLQCDLQVIPCVNYNHNSRYILPINPSPNLLSMASIYLYPSLGLFEGTIATVGKGTEYPFLIIGHPEFSDHSFSFIPESRKGTNLQTLFSGQTCYGFDLRNIMVDSLNNLKEIQLKYLIQTYKSVKSTNTFFNPFISNLAGNKIFEKQIESGMSIEEIRASWKPGLEEYKKIRAKYLLYPDFAE